jgi:type II secretory pathway pseudopilin PulG
VAAVGVLAVAVPTLLAVRSRAADHAAQASLQTTLAAARRIYGDTQTYQISDRQLDAAAAGLRFTAGSSTAAQQISLGSRVSTSTMFYAAARSASGTCWYISDNAGTVGTSGTGYAKARPGGGCVATASPSGGYTAAW